MDIKFLHYLITGRKLPPIPNLRYSNDDRFFDEGLTMGSFIIGKQGSGKTTWLANWLVEYALNHPDRPIIALDASGSLKNTYFEIANSLPAHLAENLMHRTVNDEMGRDDWVIPLPEFSPLYSLNFEEQVQRVRKNFERLAPYLIREAPVMGGLPLKVLAPELFRLLCSIQTEYGDCWQITEAKKLLVDEGLLKQAINRFGHKVPSSKYYFEREFMNESVKRSERDLRTYTFRALLEVIEPRETRAKVGFYRPGWTPKEAIEKGLIVFVSGENLTNQTDTQHYLFTQAYSMIMAEINKRRPANPDDKPVLLVVDETAALLEIEGMAEEIGKISPLYRSRKLQLIIVVQALHQLDETLRKKVWSLGNVVCFSLHDLNDAYEVAQQLFTYDPRNVKLEATHPTGQPIIEPDRGQYLQYANWIQGLDWRQCIIRRYLSERTPDKYVRFISKTRDKPKAQLSEPLEVIKERVLRERAVSVREALEVVNQRKLTVNGRPNL